MRMFLCTYTKDDRQLSHVSALHTHWGSRRVDLELCVDISSCPGLLFWSGSEQLDPPRHFGLENHALK